MLESGNRRGARTNTHGKTEQQMKVSGELGNTYSMWLCVQRTRRKIELRRRGIQNEARRGEYRSSEDEDRGLKFERTRSDVNKL